MFQVPKNVFPRYSAPPPESESEGDEGVQSQIILKNSNRSMLIYTVYSKNKFQNYNILF